MSPLISFLPGSGSCQIHQDKGGMGSYSMTRRHRCIDEIMIGRNRLLPRVRHIPQRHFNLKPSRRSAGEICPDEAYYQAPHGGAEIDLVLVENGRMLMLSENFSSYDRERSIAYSPSYLI